MFDFSAVSSPEFFSESFDAIRFETSPDSRTPGDVSSHWWQQSRAHTLLSPQAEKELAHRLRAGDESAFDRLVECNLRLVWRLALQLRPAHSALTLCDLFQEGCVGLMRAARKFDPDRGCRFSTCAVPWIRVSMTRALNGPGKMVRQPELVLRRKRSLESHLHHLTQTLGRLPRAEEQGALLPKSRFGWDETAPSEMASLDAPIGGGSDELWADVLVDAQCDVAGAVQERAVDACVLRALQQLPPRESQVLRWRFGIDGEAPRTLRQIAERLELSIETVRRIELKALERLRRDENLASICND